MKKKKILIVILALILIPAVLTGVVGVAAYKIGFSHNEEMIARLEALDGVVEVKEIWNLPRYKYAEKYMLTFEQPLDWSDPSKGTFPQRVEVAVNKNPRITVIETDGYCLSDKMSKFAFIIDPAPENVVMFDGNYVHVEQRFFGDSRPSGMSNTGTEYWEYLTSENSANDYHKIYTELSTVLGDKWIAQGTSRGGLMCNTYGYYFPDDMKVYVAYVAPCSDGIFEEERFYDFVYNEIGETKYGKEEAKNKRALVTAFQVEALKYKNNLMKDFKKELKKNTYVDTVSPEVLYDLTVLEAGVQIWQSGLDLNELNKVLDMPETSKKEINSKRKAVYKLLLKIQHPHDWASDFAAWPYYVGTAKEYGQYHYDFSYLRAALDEAGLSDRLTVTEDMEETFIQDVVFTEEQRKMFVYDGSFRDNLVASMSETNAKHMMIFGGTDPWRSVGLQPDEIVNENIKYFVHPDLPHSSKMSNLPEDMSKEAIEIMSGWLGEEAKPAE
ncbi:MAG: hypothetical protein K5776_06095 [Lachnospiraceae bacterium]|nr:hypothetical protein [Lachnospiraceae bacterium]